MVEAGFSGPLRVRAARDTLLRAEGDTLLRLSSLLLVKLAGESVRLGVAHELTRVSDAPLNDIERLGPLFVWEAQGPWLGLRKPTLFVNVYRYLKDRSKQDGYGATVAVRVRLGR